MILPARPGSAHRIALAGYSRRLEFGWRVSMTDACSKKPWNFFCSRKKEFFNRIGQLRSLSEPKPCVPRWPVYLRKLPAAELAWLASHRPKATKGFRFTTSAVQTVPDTGFESPRLLQMPLILKFVCQLCCWLSQKQPDRARLGLPVLSFPYITKWVDAHTNLPTRARWIAKADVALY